MWKTEFHPLPNCLGDEFSINISPNTTLGILTSIANTGAVVLNVSSSVVNNNYLSNGMEVLLVNGLQTEYVGRIININKYNLQITIELPLSNSFNMGTLIKINTYMLKKFKIYQTSSTVKFGEKGIVMKKLPKNTIIRVEYKNNDGLAKTLYLDIEYYYS